MAKKKKSQPSPSSTLKSLIHAHSLFFDSLVELIPARFYLPADDKDRPWFHGLSHAAKGAAKKESRENLKKARRDRLDPDTPSNTLQILQNTIENEKRVENDENTSGDEDQVEPKRQVTYEELRQRLRMAIEAKQSTRNTSTVENPRLEAEREKKKEKKRERKKMKGNRPVEKRKREEEDVEERKSVKKPKGTERECNPGAVDLSFGHVKINENDRKKNKKGVSKKTALAKAERLQEAKRDPAKGEVVSKKHSWKAAVSRAAGVKVHDNPKLIKESLKKEKKKKEKNAEKWKERKESVQKFKADKQKKRADNIGEKIQQKKSRKIAKREKKLMHPGAEGRKAS